VMSGLPYPDRVTVVINGETLNGCGGDTKSLLTGPEWIVEDINGSGVIDMAQTSIAFSDDNSVSGSGGCNRFSGSYQITGEGIRFGPIAATRKACAMALMDQELAFFEVLETASLFEIESDGALKVTGDENRSFTARR
jgi:heat shock protein HslJ